MAEAFFHYDRVASSYDQPQHQVFYGHLAEKLCILAKKHVQPRSILDLGCGTGISTREIVKHFPKAEVTALDRSLSMLALAQKKEELKASSFCHGRSRDLTHLNKRFDLIIANMSFHWLSLEDRLALRDALREKGLLAVSFPLITSFTKREGNKLLFTIFRRFKKMDPAWRPFRGRRGLNWNELASLPGLAPLYLQPYCMEESFRRGSELLEALRVRGVFFSFFGDQAALAEEHARSILADAAPVSHFWPLGLAILGRNT